MNQETINKLRSIGACESAIHWVAQQQSPAQAWRECDRADWMMWLIARTCTHGSDQHKRLVLLGCRIAADALKKHWKRDDSRPSEAIRVARLWARDRATVEQVSSAAAAAAAAAAANAANDAAYAAAAAAYVAADAAAAAAAYVAYAAAAANAANDAAYVAYAAAYGDYAAERGRSLARYAKWVRKDFPKPPRLT